MITFQPADPAPDGAHSRAVWEWRNDPVARQMSRATEPIAWPAHRQWYERTAGAAGTALLIAMVDGTPACMVRFDTLQPGTAQIHININPALREKGLGRPILAAACAYGFAHLKLSFIDAILKAENPPSIKLFTSVGFTRAGERAGRLAYRLTRD